MLKTLTTAILALTLASTAGHAQSVDKPPVLEDLTNEPSRAALFMEHVKRTPGEGHSLLLNHFIFPDQALKDQGVVRKNAIFGIDISHHTSSDFPFAQLKANEVRFVYVKASQGTRYRDAKFASFWSDLTALTGEQRVHKGAYHFLSATPDADPRSDGQSQAKTFVYVLSLSGAVTSTGAIKDTDMPPALDLEEDYDSAHQDRWNRLSSTQIIDKVRAWLTYVEKTTGRRPIVYTSKSWWDARIGRAPKDSFAALLPGYLVWVADYSRTQRAVEQPQRPADAPMGLWQFTASAEITDLFPGGLDATIYKGSQADFFKKFNVKPFTLADEEW